jgi:hypothetical protein
LSTFSMKLQVALRAEAVWSVPALVRLFFWASLFPPRVG